MSLLQFLILLWRIHSNRPPDARQIQALGLLAVKVAQHYALRVDFLAPATCQELARLFRATEAVPPAAVDDLILTVAEPGWLDHFTAFDRNAFASASIGQVHRATLTSGEAVVVKLIRNPARDAFLSDLARVKKFAGFLVRIYPTLERVFNPLDALDYIESYTLAELDLRNEIAGFHTLDDLRAEWSERYDLSRLRFPKYYPEMSGESVLVSEWIDGETFDEKLDQGTLEYETLVDFFKIHGFYLFGMGVYHGDIHPGNLMLDRQQQIVLIDNGAISRVGDATRIGLLDFFEALANDDFTESAQRLRAMSHTALDEAKYRKFVTAFLALYRDFSGKSVGELSLTRQMMLTIRMAVEHGMTFGDDMFGIIKGLMYLDGMTLRCHPQANLMMDIRGFVDGLRRALAIPSVSTHGASPQCGVDLPVQ